MEAINFTIDNNDLKSLFIACKVKQSFDKFVKECEQGYRDYHQRNLDNLEKYGQPKTYSQWVNGQIISLTSYNI
jgi:hypothetical protein